MLEITRGLGIYRWRVRDDRGHTTEWRKHRKSVWKIVTQGELEGVSYDVGEPGWTITTATGAQVGQAEKDSLRAVRVFAADGSVYDMLIVHAGLCTGLVVSKDSRKLGEIKGDTIGTVRCELPSEVPLPIQFLMGWILHKIQIADGSISSAIESSLEGHGRSGVAGHGPSSRPLAELTPLDASATAERPRAVLPFTRGLSFT